MASNMRLYSVRLLVQISFFCFCLFFLFLPISNIFSILQAFVATAQWLLEEDVLLL